MGLHQNIHFDTAPILICQDLSETFLLELGHGSPVVASRIETVVFSIISGKQTVGKRRERHESYAQFFKQGKK